MRPLTAVGPAIALFALVAPACTIDLSQIADGGLDGAGLPVARDGGVDATALASDAGAAPMNDGGALDAPSPSDAATAPSIDAAVPAPIPLPAGSGWQVLPGTKIDTVCAAKNGFPSVAAVEGCAGILSWSGGVLDTTRERLIVWGGGHNAYYGNEIYGLDLGAKKMSRLNDPGLPLALCTAATANGTQAASRHTYDGIEYLPNVDRMFVFGGALACDSGGLGADTWTFSFATMTWKRMNPSGPIPRANPGVTTAYDPTTKLLFLHDQYDLYSYDFAKDEYVRLHQSAGSGYHLNATIDPVRRRFLLLGHDAYAGKATVISYDIAQTSAVTRQVLATVGGDAVLGTTYPGVDYDPVRDRVVAWNGGDSVYSLDMDALVWSVATAPGGPGPLPPSSGTGSPGTHGRFRYSPASNAFVVVNGVSTDAYAFRF